MKETPEEWLHRMKSYVIAREKALDRDLLPLGDPRGKAVLVFGCGYGNEIMWAIRHGAASVVGIDLNSVRTEPLEAAMAEQNIAGAAWEMRSENIHDTALRPERYDLIVSNGVFEHVMDLKGVLQAFRDVLNPGGRIAIFADGLWYSSIGGHTATYAWEHLRKPRVQIAVDHADRWEIVKNRLNRMTCMDFLGAVRDTGAIVLQMHFNSDPRIVNVRRYIDEIRQNHQVTPTDLSIVSIACELCFVEHV